MTTFVLVPGAGGQAWFWHRLVAELDARGHEAIAVELPGDDDTAGLDVYAKTVVDAIGDRRHVVLVAQSLGGFTAPQVCQEASVDLLVLLNAMIPAPGETAGAWWDNTGQAQASAEMARREGRSEEFDLRDVFFHDVPEEVTAEAMAGGRDQSGRPFGDVWPLDHWPDVPTRVLVGRDDRFFPADFQRRIARERLGITPDEMPGGHLLALSRPAELADRLEDYARDVG